MTAQEQYRLYQQEKTKAENAKRYHIDDIRQFDNKVVATSDAWDYKLHIYNDNSASLVYIAKNPESGYKSGIWCGIASLKSHLRHLCNVRYDTEWVSLFDGVNWIVTESGFFKALGIA